MTKKQHKHAKVIRAWAGGEEIEFCRPNETTWQPAPDPAFIEDYFYRVKPARSYPEIALQNEQLDSVFRRLQREDAPVLRAFTDFVIRDLIDNGQVVTREEFALAIGDRDKRDMAIAKAAGEAVRNGTKVRGTIVWFPVLDLDAIIAEAVK